MADLAPDFETESFPDRHRAIDMICAVLVNWVEEAGLNERAACQTRNSIIFGMTVFITGGATILAHFELAALALIFAAAMAFVTAFLNHVFENESRSWRETVKILTRIQHRIVAALRGGADDVDLQAALMEEEVFRGSDQPMVITPHDVARSKRKALKLRDMDWGSRLLYGFIGLSILVVVLESHRDSDDVPTDQAVGSSSEVQQLLPSPPRPRP